MSQFHQGNEQKTKKIFWQRLWIGIVTLAVALLLVGAAFTFAPHPTSAQNSTVNIASNIARQQQLLQAQMAASQKTTTVSQNTAIPQTDTSQSCKDPAATYNNNTAAGNIDGNGDSYSIDVLSRTKIPSSFVEDDIQFNWYNAPYTDCISNGQILPITNATTNDGFLGLIGSATNGAVAGNATIKYDDGSTQLFQLGFSDWTLGGSTQTPSYGNKIVAAQGLRNTRQGQQLVKTYLFFTKVALQPNKKAISLTMPLLTSRAQLHLFAWSTTTSHSADLYNNIASTNDAYPQVGQFDGSGNSYSSNMFNWQPGGAMDVIPQPGEFIAPDVLGGTRDNYVATGQTIPLNAAGKAFGSLDFAGAAASGPSYGTASVHYTDGTQQAFTLGFSDWTLNGGTQAPSFSNQPLASSSYRNTPRGQQNISVFIFKTNIKIQANKIVQSVTLPSSTNQGKLHIFSIALSDIIGMDIGSTADSSPLFGNIDGTNHSYSQDALIKAHIPMSSINGVENAFSFHGSILRWIGSLSMYANNWIADGQPMVYQSAVAANATHITFMGAAINGNSTGTGTVYYTDGTSSPYTVSFTDWCASTAQFGNIPLATLPYRNTAFGQQSIKNSVYYAEAAIDPTKTLQSITLPHTTGGQMHIFDYGYRVGPYNNIGGRINEELQIIDNFDGQRNGYSYDALSAAGLPQGPVTINGVTFNWRNVYGDNADNYQANSQVVPVTPVAQAKTLAFLGASTGGSASGTATITYTDGSKQTFTLGLTDWCASTIAFNNRVAAAATYRHTPHGDQTIKTSVYYTDVALQSGKTIKSVTLPNNGQIHIFAISTK